MDSDLIFLLAIGAFYVLRHFLGAKQRQAGPGAPRVDELPPLPGESVAMGRSDPDLDEALREIRQALGMPSAEPRADAPSPPPVARRAPMPARPTPAPQPVAPRTQMPARPTPAPSPAASRAQTPARPTPAPSRTQVVTRTQMRVDDGFREVRTGRPDAEERFERLPKREAVPTPRSAADPKAEWTTYGDSSGSVRQVSTKSDPFAWHDPLEGHSHLDAAPTVTRNVETTLHPSIDRLRSEESLREAMLLKEILGPPRSRRRR